MNKPNVRIHNIETDKIIDREMTDDEFAQYEIKAQTKARAQSEAQAKAIARQALLTRLGITEEEARILLGGN